MTCKMFCLGLIILLLTSCKVNQQNSLHKFTGMWKLDKYEAYDSSKGKWQDAPNRMGYTGYILYDGVGHMGVQLHPPEFGKHNFNKSTDSLNNDELRQIVKLANTTFNYFANCNVAGKNTIEHHIISSNNPEDIGTTVRRNFEFKGDTLILNAQELIGGFKVRLRWVKLK